MTVEEVETAGLTRVGGIVPLVVAAHRDGDLLIKSNLINLATATATATAIKKPPSWRGELSIDFDVVLLRSFSVIK